MNELTQGLCPAPSGTKNPVQRLTSSLGSGNCLGSTHPPVQQTQSSASLYTNFLLRLEPPLCPVRQILSFHITFAASFSLELAGTLYRRQVDFSQAPKVCILEQKESCGYQQKWENCLVSPVLTMFVDLPLAKPFWCFIRHDNCRWANITPFHIQGGRVRGGKGGGKGEGRGRGGLS